MPESTSIIPIGDGRTPPWVKGHHNAMPEGGEISSTGTPQQPKDARVCLSPPPPPSGRPLLVQNLLLCDVASQGSGHVQSRGQSGGNHRFLKISLEQSKCRHSDHAENRFIVGQRCGYAQTYQALRP